MSETDKAPATDRANTFPETHDAVVRKLADAMLRSVLWSSGATITLGIVVFAVPWGLPGALGALVGGAVALGSSLATLWLMRRTAAASVQRVMVAALGGFAGKVLVLLVVMTLLRGLTVLHPMALALTMAGTILLATGAEVRAFAQVKVPTIITEPERG
ncbi:hypothetical protein GCM10012275_02890 [Longimycelium tulufanense]|uniref:ATP synthase protein I n=1 Tax=Longimycelium tulufanense TaxID=907463 RepID=A0A8J3C623_9PSEU|nr:hypothetical protein [Longimycelium tulufanense]GGM35060.1 hypothetical protein GCM10012275_02890 [Longimycelium tulufanense]